MQKTSVKPRREIEFEKIVHGGDALGRADDGRPVFVPFAAPGERALVEIVEEKKGYLRGRLVEILSPSPVRVPPRCAHFGECGGCQLQHLTYAAQLHSKQAILREQLLRLGGIADAPLREIIPSPSEWRYRNHMQFSLASGGTLGFHRASSSRVMPVRECPLMEPELDALWKILDFEQFPGLRQVALRGGTDGSMIVFESETGETPETVTEADLSIAVVGPDGEAGYLAGGPLRYEVMGKTFQVSAGSSFQVNTGMIPALIETVLELAQPQPGEAVLDVCCGTGLFSAFFAGKTARVAGIEESPSSAADFVVNLDEFDNVELYEASAEQALDAVSGPFDMAVVDPPCGGMDPKAMQSLLRLAPGRIIMVSCDPATLGRDARVLRQSGFVLREMIPLDVFPQTAHLESVSSWHKE